MSSRKVPSFNKLVEASQSANTTEQQESRITSTSNATETLDSAFEVDMAYNSYLQARLKQHLVDEEITKHEQCMNDQMLKKTGQLQKANETLEETRSQLGSLRKTVEINEWLQTFKNNLSLLEQSLARSSVADMQQDLVNILSNQLGQVSLINIRPLESEKDIQQIYAIFQDLKEVLKRISDMNGRNFQEVSKLADRCKELHALHKEMSKATQKISQINHNAIMQFLVSASDSFAQDSD